MNLKSIFGNIKYHCIQSAWHVLPVTVLPGNSAPHLSCSLQKHKYLSFQVFFRTTRHSEATSPSRYSRCTARRSIEAKLEQELNKNSNLLRRSTSRILIRSFSLDPCTPQAPGLLRACTYVPISDPFIHPLKNIGQDPV